MKRYPKNKQKVKQKYFILIYMAVFLGILGIFWFQAREGSLSIATEGQAITTNTCIDSDGKDFLRKGTVTFDDQIFEDKCTKRTEGMFSGLVEYYCDAGQKKELLVSCICDKGSC
jgi:hypothetical protein